MLKHLLFVASSVVLINTAQGQPVSYPSQKEKLENIILAKVGALAEVKSYMHNNKASKPILMIDREPDSTYKYYCVAMGISNFDMFRISERFCVDPRTLKVYFWDVFADDTGFSYSAIIPIEKWRILRKTPGWNKPHTYRQGKLVALAN